ncbi:hypothetical protein Tco_0629821 [Tanacetum coccineum]|uniref:Uncharacterized protein n=1 Tax=Tanacetum coccineum TaxID=301880 RepID=A0ABQ4WU65_9ASTR
MDSRVMLFRLALLTGVFGPLLVVVSSPGCLDSIHWLLSAVLPTHPACPLNSSASYPLMTRDSHNHLVLTPTITVAVSSVLGDGSRVYTHHHDGSEAPDESPDSILSSLVVELSPTSYLEPKVDKYNLLQGGCSDSRISSLWSTGGGMYRDGGSGGSGGDGNAAVGPSHLARRSPAEGGDSEIGGDGDGVVQGARSLALLPLVERDMEGLGPQDGNHYLNSNDMRVGYNRLSSSGGKTRLNQKVPQ